MLPSRTPSIASAAETIPALFTAWSTQRQSIRVNNMPDHVVEVAADNEVEIARTMLAAQPATLAELAMKLVVCTDGGLDLLPRALVEEMDALARETLSLGFEEKVEPVMAVKQTPALRAEDLVYESIHLVQLVAMAIEGLELDTELKALSAGVHVIAQRLSEATVQMEMARR
ncbi:hypothetical protein [Sinorhizobium meliloti]|uniref:hypothetical protein n=1 Tax=Rhizobium meliloti TaxID=382 RepID=UPI000FDA1324|nr:hypothetical protein [Sinorhizobium meliloti]RVL05646.1 hypothetical protein CN152_03320 [Sinorhizobium meliloti]RVN49950.1 hypothetical protein CN113_06905 [Sinorhizobium meliloti]